MTQSEQGGEERGGERGVNLNDLLMNAYLKTSVYMQLICVSKKLLWQMCLCVYVYVSIYR